MTINSRPRRTAQHGLFESEKEKQAREDSHSRRVRWEKQLARLATEPNSENTRVCIVRGFLDLHYAITDTKAAMNKRLECLGGRTLLEVCSSDWAVVCAWMKEIKMYPNEKPFYIEEKKENKNEEQKQLPQASAKEKLP